MIEVSNNSAQTNSLTMERNMPQLRRENLPCVEKTKIGH